jgi:lipopolysaccharide transport system permease protein
MNDSINILIKQALASAKASVKTRYRQSYAGFIWVVINPIIMFLVQSLIFKHVLALEISRFYLFLLSGLLPWLFLVQTLEMTANSFAANGRITKAYSVSPLVFLTAQILDNLLNFIFAFVILLAAVSFFDPISMVHAIGIILPLFFLVVGVWGLSLWLATLQVFYSDTKFVLTFLLSIGFFVTPIFYSEDLLPQNLKWMPQINILYILIKPIRESILGHGTFESYFKSCAISAGVSTFLVVSSWRYWRNKKNQVFLNV